jgi:hypothetical protein
MCCEETVKTTEHSRHHKTIEELIKPALFLSTSAAGVNFNYSCCSSAFKWEHF